MSGGCHKIWINVGSQESEAATANLKMSLRGAREAYYAPKRAFQSALALPAIVDFRSKNMAWDLCMRKSIEMEYGARSPEKYAKDGKLSMV